MSAIILYGIPNCDSCRKAQNWLKAGAYPYRFHDLRVDGTPDANQILNWSEQLGWENILNRRSTAFRGLTSEERDISHAEEAVELIVRYPLLLKRPLIESSLGIVAGFDPDRLTGILPHE